jgi:hypothetical protein
LAAGTNSGRCAGGADYRLTRVSASRFIVDVEVELPTDGTDLLRNTRVYNRLADALPRGTAVMADVGQGLAHMRAWIPATSEGALGALHAVTLAMNVALHPEQAAVESLGWRTPPQPRPRAKPVVMRLSIVEAGP